MSWPRAGGAVQVTATARARPQHFIVTEQLSFEPDGEGEHAMLYLEKISANTGWVATQLADFAGVRRRDVSFAGRKDRHAVTRQWFSVWLPGKQVNWDECSIEGVTIVKAQRHSKKLRIGALRANQFELLLTELNGDVEKLLQRLESLSTTGVPNYFGAQRFGRDSQNLQRARDFFAARIRLRGDRRSMALSAARSYIFNQVLAERVRSNNWNQVLPGDALSLDGTESFFVVAEPDTILQKRLNEADVHVTGPLWGDGKMPTQANVAELESGVAARYPDLADGLVASRMKHERRSLRVMPRKLSWAVDADQLKLSFELPRGCYATTVLQELLDLNTVEPGASAA